MMPLIRRLALALALLAAPAVAAAQPGAPPRDPAGEMMEAERRARRPFEALLRNRDRLGLSGDQVARLEGIGERLEARNRPLREQLRREQQRWTAQRRRQLARLTPAERRDTLHALREQRRMGAGPGVPAPMRPLVERMRGNIRTAVQEAQRVLTPQQKQRARRLLREHRRELREGRRGPGAGAWRGGGQ